MMIGHDGSIVALYLYKAVQAVDRSALYEAVDLSQYNAVLNNAIDRLGSVSQKNSMITTRSIQNAIDLSIQSNNR
jgi:hypothetical protein